MPEKLLEYGLSGAVMGVVMYWVVKPLVNALLGQLAAVNQQIEAERRSRETVCIRHEQFHERTLHALDGLLASVDGLVRRANGGK